MIFGRLIKFVLMAFFNFAVLAVVLPLAAFLLYLLWNSFGA